ncbi:hypothetical protein JCM8202_005892 [Rhodotorula sphaerocarpa]
MPKTCLLTVGSTRFDPLVHAFLSADSLAALAEVGITRVVAQVGNSSLAPAAAPAVRAAKAPELGVQPFGDGDAAQGELVVVRFADDLEAQVGQADLVVSHAGAGSLLSFLRPLPLQAESDPSASSSPQPRARTLVLVPNSTLMDSHQSDLAEEMDKKGWATVCWKPEDLPITLRKLAAAKPATEPHSGGAAKSAFPALDKGKVQRILDEVLGYA